MKHFITNIINKKGEGELAGSPSPYSHILSNCYRRVALVALDDTDAAADGTVVIPEFG
jgi:hypothetical protein